MHSKDMKGVFFNKPFWPLGSDGLDIEAVVEAQEPGLFMTGQGRSYAEKGARVADY